MKGFIPCVICIVCLAYNKVWDIILADVIRCCEANMCRIRPRFSGGGKGLGPYHV